MQRNDLNRRTGAPQVAPVKARGRNTIQRRQHVGDLVVRGRWLTGYVQGLPAAAYRGGRWSDGPRAGVFSLGLDHAPSHWTDFLGLRCVVPSS